MKEQKTLQNGSKSLKIQIRPKIIISKTIKHYFLKFYYLLLHAKSIDHQIVYHINIYQIFLMTILQQLTQVNQKLSKQQLSMECFELNNELSFIEYDHVFDLDCLTIEKKFKQQKRKLKKQIEKYYSIVKNNNVSTQQEVYYKKLARQVYQQYKKTQKKILYYKNNRQQFEKRDYQKYLTNYQKSIPILSQDILLQTQSYHQYQHTIYIYPDPQIKQLNFLMQELHDIIQLQWEWKVNWIFDDDQADVVYDYNCYNQEEEDLEDYIQQIDNQYSFEKLLNLYDNVQLNNYKVSKILDEDLLIPQEQLQIDESFCDNYYDCDEKNKKDFQKDHSTVDEETNGTNVNVGSTQSIQHAKETLNTNCLEISSSQLNDRKQGESQKKFICQGYSQSQQQIQIFQSSQQISLFQMEINTSKFNYSILCNDINYLDEKSNFDFDNIKDDLYQQFLNLRMKNMNHTGIQDQISFTL